MFFKILNHLHGGFGEVAFKPERSDSFGIIRHHLEGDTIHIHKAA